MSSKLITFALGALMLAGIFGCDTTEENPDLSAADPQMQESEAPVVQWVSEPIEGQYIVVLQDNVPSVQAVAGEMAASKNASTLHLYEATIKGFAVKMSADAARELALDPRVKYVEQDQMITLNLPAFVEKNPGTTAKPVKPAPTPSQTTPWGITRVGGAVNYTGSNVAWVLDTGIDLDHPDLNVINCTTSGLCRTEFPREGFDDLNGHGTHVAGTIAAKNNTEGVIGVAANATVIPVKVLDRRGSGSFTGVIAGIDWVASKGKSGDVANMSLSGGKSDAVNAAVEKAAAKGIKFALAAGNDGTHANTRSPASAEGTNIYTISAINSSDVFASWSNYGNPPVDYAEPGVSVNSTWKGGGYNTISGTSMAAPHAAGILLLGQIKSYDTAQGDPDGNPDPIGVR